MHSSFHSVNALSPESTVTSLLSSSGHLTSNLQPSALSSSFTYKDKEYLSASAALDAYITDFEHSRHGNTALGSGLECSRHGNASLGAGLVLPPFSPPHRTPLGTLRNRDVLRERLSDRELDFLSLPISSLRHRSNRDRISMTTDELLNIPNDGSMPVTHTSAFIHGLVSRSGVSQIRSPVKHTCNQSHTSRPSHPIRTLRCSRCGGGAQRTNREPQLSSAVQPDPRATASSSSKWAGPPSASLPDWPSSRDRPTMHLPHWLSSNKAAVDCSEIHSLPELPYPPWIQHCGAGQSERGYHSTDQSEHSYHSTDQSERGYKQGQSEISHDGQSQSSEIEDFPASAPSWVRELDDDRLADSEVTLRNLRLQFAEHISQLGSDRTGPDSVDSLYRDKRIESLIQKADRVLDSLQNSATGSPVPAPDRTEDLLLQDLDPGSDPAAQPSGAVRSQPGPLEAIKQILFRLEAVETELQRRHSLQQGALQDTQWESLQEKLKRREAQTNTAQESEIDDGGPSLQRALHHLSRLKLLVEKPETPAREEEERDEGRFSSSSTEEPGVRAEAD